jgi:hypothetical protein
VRRSRAGRPGRCSEQLRQRCLHPGRCAAQLAGAVLGVDPSRVVGVEQLGHELGVTGAHPATLKRRNPLGSRQFSRHDVSARKLRERRRDIDCCVAPRPFEMDDARPATTRSLVGEQLGGDGSYVRRRHGRESLGQRLVKAAEHT